MIYYYSISEKSLPWNRTDIISNKNYPKKIEYFRNRNMKQMKDEIYLDYTGASMYNPQILSLLRNEFYDTLPFVNKIPNSTKKTAGNYIKDARNSVLNFLHTNSSEYSVIFLASATHALKLVGEFFPWSSSSKYIYTKYNHNSVLGIRKYALSNNATFNVVDSYENVTNVVRSLYKEDEKMKHLIAFPLEDNFAGTKMQYKQMKELTNEESAKNGNYALFADAAAFLPTNKLNLSDTPFHAVCLSFYKIIGFPNVGALIIRNDFAQKLRKSYYSMYSGAYSNDESSDNQLHNDIQQRLEDDSITPDNALAITKGLEFISSLGIKNINDHVWKLTRKLVDGLSKFNITIYGNHALNNNDIQGGIVSFNMYSKEGTILGYSKVVSDASKHRIHLRGGCHCNPGACFTSSKLNENRVKEYFDKKETCGDSLDVIDGIPLGAVRASLGWSSTDSDIEGFLTWIKNYLEM